MDGLQIVIVALMFLYFLSILFTLLLAGKLLKHRPTSMSVAGMMVLAAVITAIFFWTGFYQNIPFGFLLIYFVLVIGTYIIYAGFFGFKLPRKKQNEV